MSKQFRWFDDWKRAPLRCAACGWKGELDPDAVNAYDQLVDFTCPGCEKILAIVSYPAPGEIRPAAEAGNNPEAAKMLSSVTAREERHARFAASRLNGPEQLPDLEGDALEFAWDFEEEGDESWIIIRCGGQAIWRELAHWEDMPRFNEVKALLRSKYAVRFQCMKPTPAAELYLFGDDISAPGKIEYS